MQRSVAERRRQFLTLVLKRARPGTGSPQALLRRRTALRQWPNLGEVLEGTRWAVVGAVGARAYMPERATSDLDIVVAAADAAEIHRRLLAAGFRPGPPLADDKRSYTAPDGVPVDVIESDAPWIEEALRSLRTDPQGLPAPALPYLVLMEVQAGRTQDLADAARMLGAAREEDLEAVRSVFRRWMPDALEDLESLIALGRLEMEDPGRDREP